MKLSKVIIFRDNFAFKLSNIAFKGISLVSNILRLFKKDRIINWEQKSYNAGYGMNKKVFYLEEISEIPEIIFGDKK